MKHSPTLVTILIFLTCLLGVTTFSQGQTLNEVYKTGKISLEEVIRIDFDSFPEEVPLKGINGYAITKNGNIFIADMNLHNLKVLNSSGKFIKTVGQKGAGPGDLAYPWHLVFNGKHVYVYEIRNHRFSLFNEDGSFFKVIKPQKNLRVKKMRALKTGDLVIQTEIYNYGKNIGQEALVAWYSPELEERRLIYKKNVLTNKFIKEPMRTNIPQPYQPLVSWNIAKNGDVFTAFQDKYEIERHQLQKGKVSSFTHKCTRAPVTEKDKEVFFAGLTFSSGDKTMKGAPKFVLDNTDFPKYKPIFDTILTDPEGNILVFPTLSSNASEMVFDAFTPDGTFINRVKLPSGKLSLFNTSFHEQYIWTIIQNEDEESTLVKYKIRKGK